MMKTIATAVSFLLLSCGAALGAEAEQNKETETSMASKKKSDAENKKGKKAETDKTKPFAGREAPGWVYHLSQAQWHSRELKESTMIKVANAIEERAWTQAQAAKLLGVSQPRISDLMRGQSSKFTLDTLVEMLYALDKPATIVIDEAQSWNLSKALPISEKELESKIAFFTNVIKDDPNNIAAFQRRGAAYDELKKYELAIGDFTRCLEIDPNNLGARSARANAYSDAGQYKAAIQDCNELMRRFPDYNGYQNRGLIYGYMGENELAMADHTKAIEMDPQRPGPHWNRAELNRKLGHIDEAIKDYEDTLKADPTYKGAQEAIDELRKRQKK